MLVLPLHHPHALAGIEVGNFVHQLQPVIQAKLPIIPGLIIPISTLRQIAEANSLEQKLAGMLGQHTSIHHIEDFFAQLKLNHDISRELLRLFHEHLDGYQVKIFPSWVKLGHVPSTELQTHQGDAQVIEAMLREWGKCTWYTAQHHTLQPWLTAAIVAAVHPSNAAEITVATKAQIGDNNVAITLKMPPSDPVHFQVDVRTWHVITRTAAPQHLLLVNDTTLIELAQQTYQAKRLTIEHLNCTWQLHGQTWVVSQCQPLFTQEISPAAPTYHTRGKWQGVEAVPGQVRGQLTVIGNHQALPKKWPQPTILVTSHLDRLELNQVRNLLGVICEQGCDQQPYQLLRQFNIPTVLQVARATHNLRSHMLVELDSQTGIINEIQTPSPLGETHQPALAVISWLPAELTAIPTHHQQHLPPAGYVLGIKHIEAKVGIPGQVVRPLLHLPYTWMRLEWSPTRHASQLEAELQQIQRAEKWWPTHPHLITPALHATVEVGIFLKQLMQSGLASDWPLWWHVTTPENILNAQTYLHQLKPRGVVINVTQLISHLTGIQFWDQSVAAMYPQPTQLVVEFMRHLHQELAQARLPVFWQISQIHLKLLSAALRFKVAGVMVSPYYVGETYLLLEQHLTFQDESLWQ